MYLVSYWWNETLRWSEFFNFQDNVQLVFNFLPSSFSTIAGSNYYIDGGWLLHRECFKKIPSLAVSWKNIFAFAFLRFLCLGKHISDVCLTCDIVYTYSFKEQFSVLVSLRYGGEFYKHKILFLIFDCSLILSSIEINEI